METLSIFAWMGVIIIQAFIHYSLVAQKRQHEEEEGPLDIALLDDEEEEGLSPRGAYVDSSPLEVLDVQSDSLDGDEPQIFFQLLTQTGSEMLHVSTIGASPRVSRVDSLVSRAVHTHTELFLWWFKSSPSLERIVEEQINID